jgi:nitrogen fixation protein
MNDWGLADPMSYKGEGVYEVAINLDANIDYGFKVASEDWSTVDLGNSVNPAVVEGDTKPLFVGNDNLSINVGTTATYIFTLDATDTSAPTLTVVNEEPYVGNPIFIRGGMNGWGTGNELAYQGGRIYTTAIDLMVTDYEFKVANDGWSMPNLGGFTGDEVDVRVNLGENLALSEGGDNLKLSITEAGSYVFIFDTVDLEAPVVRVFNEEFFGTNTVFIRGTMNGWGETDALSYDGGGVYSVNITLDGTDTVFKVATSDWSTVNLGADGADNAPVTIGEGKVLFKGDNPENMTIAAPPAGDYQFKVIGPDGNAPTILVTPIIP